MPSPYGRQRPTTSARPAARSTRNSRASRDLPIPGGPTIVHELRQPLASHRSCSASLQRRELVAHGRRTGASIGRVKAGASGEHLEQAVSRDRSALPFSVERLATASTRKASRTSGTVASPSRISPGPAACSSRAATLTASPGDERLARARPTTSPVLTPMRSFEPESTSTASPHLVRRRVPLAAHRPRAPAGRRTRPSRRRRRTSPPCRRDARGSSAASCVVARHQLAQHLRVGALAERRRAGEVAEQHGDRLARVGRHVGNERRAAAPQKRNSAGFSVPQDGQSVTSRV